ncbi:hypothetical protein [Planomonospora parontospora]|uniref:hypothetical protein n=1 Tax=Planomonospora parontospora TaxID=58119 RepID=UPI00166F7B04|nr:hypothetical protein [Planomonospora parontospora]GGL51559.1 hypothetical protein GCM10014719_61090 [Planomonospora parontospora subsp. antibiotica]GII20217.1 hypothetical protein Ppa05_69430 [Planomonospora parontospora subsp. antibiotica]
MAELIRSVEDEMPISYSRFDLVDGSGLGHDAEQETETGALLTEPGRIALGQVGIKSQAWARTAHVRMEAWDSEPPAPGTSWSEAGQVLYLSPGGTVFLCSLEVGHSGQMLLIGPPFFAYGLRAYAGPVRTRPADGDGALTEAVEETWLLQFWPLADVAAPALRTESETGGQTAARMREILPLAPGSAAPISGEWPALHPLPAPEPPTGILLWSHPAQSPAPASDHEAEGRISRGIVPQETPASWQRTEEALGDLRIDMLGGLPAGSGSWSRSQIEEYATRLRTSMRIGGELNPHGAPTLRLEASSVRTVLIGPDPGFSGRAWVWASDERAHVDVLSVDRQHIVRDRIRQNTLLTGIVTILRNESGFVEVRAATEVEAARVITVERLRG